jgi:hypothetical protein
VTTPIEKAISDSIAAWTSDPTIDLYDRLLANVEHVRAVERARWNYERRLLLDSLTYVSRPTMGIPPGGDASAFALNGAPEGAARYALSNCILNAQGALTQSLAMSGPPE